MIDQSLISTAVKAMFEQISFTAEPAGLYDPLRYMISIGGKRIRPTLCLMTYSLFRDELAPEVMEPAAGLEVFHTFTLIHDDIMDKSPLRRGMPTVWKRWKEDTAILSGDVMLIDAYDRMCKAPAGSGVLPLFSRTAAQVCEGQQYDMDFEEREDVSMEEYEQMIGLKTAVLLACSAEVGARVAGAPEQVCKAIYRYGYELGMAFQVADDLLDAYGDEKVFGKPIGGDIVNCKKSWLTIRALEKTGDRTAFLSAMAMPADSDRQKADKIAAVKGIYDSLGVADDAKECIIRYNLRAHAALEGLGLPEDGVEMLRSFADRLVGRAV